MMPASCRHDDGITPEGPRPAPFRYIYRPPPVEEDKGRSLFVSVMVNMGVMDLDAEVYFDDLVSAFGFTPTPEALAILTHEEFARVLPPVIARLATAIGAAAKEKEHERRLREAKMREVVANSEFRRYALSYLECKKTGYQWGEMIDRPILEAEVTRRVTENKTGGYDRLSREAQKEKR